MTESNLRIKAICVYPIKSFRGCELPSMTASAAGFSHDRRFMLQRVSDEKHMSIGKMFEMCLFTTELSPPTNPTTILVRYTLDHVFNRPDEPVDRDAVLEVPLEPDWQKDGLKERLVTMHQSPTYGYEMADSYNEWFSTRFGYAVRFIYVGENRRKVLGSVAPSAKAPLGTNANGNDGQGVVNWGQSWMGTAKSWVSSVIVGSDPPDDDDDDDNDDENRLRGVDHGIGWADVAPFLVVSSKSYDDAAARISDGEDLDVWKFRPNIVVEGATEEWEEDYWAELEIGDAGAGMVLTSNCARCASINVEYDTGKQGDGEAGKILKLLQKDRRVDPGMKYSPIFGRYGFLARKGVVKDDGEVLMKVGDTVKVVRRNDERTRFQWPGISTDK